MKKIIFVCAIAVAAVLTSCETKKAERAQVVDNIYTEEADGGGYNLLVKYSEGQFSSPLNEKAVDRAEYNKDADLVFAYTGKTFSIFTKDGNARGEGGYEAYNVDGDIVHFAKGNQTMLYTKKGIVIGTFANGDFVIEKSFIFTKNPKGLWSLRDLNGDYLTDISYDQIYVIDLKDDGSFDKLCCRDGAWSLTGSDGGAYDKASTDVAVKALKKKNPTAPVGVLDI